MTFSKSSSLLALFAVCSFILFFVYTTSSSSSQKDEENTPIANSVPSTSNNNDVLITDDDRLINNVLPPKIISQRRKEILVSTSSSLSKLASIGRECYLRRWGGDKKKEQQEEASSSVSKTQMNPSTQSKITVSLIPSTSCIKIKLKRAKSSQEVRGGKSTSSSSFTSSSSTRKLARELRLENGWTEGFLFLTKKKRKDNSGTATQPIFMKRFFLWNDDDNQVTSSFSSDLCGLSFSSLSSTSQHTDNSNNNNDGERSTDDLFSLEVMTVELFQGNDALIETGEDLPVKYFTKNGQEEKTVIRLDLTQQQVEQYFAIKKNTNNKDHLSDQQPADWSLISEDKTTNYEKDSKFSGYWLKFKGDSTRGNKFSNTHDLLGRMDFRSRYGYSSSSSSSLSMDLDRNSSSSSSCAHFLPPPLCDKKTCFYSSLRNRIIVFIGDSHVRTLYYGLLERLGISFAANRVWRGGHESEISEINAELKFFPSSFLDLKTVESNLEKISSSKNTNSNNVNNKKEIIIVAGLGQHHSTHCYTLERHSESMKQSFEYFSAKQKQQQKTKKQKMKFIWYGIPAQPVNRHLFAPKPVGQNRRDCRNNARHLLYSTVQQFYCREYNVPFIDAFALSASLSFTSIDGAHYYSFVREAMLDSLGEELSKR